MIRAGGLNVGIVRVEAEVDETGFSLVIPFALTVPEFARARLERHTVERNAEPTTACIAGRSVGLRLERDAEIVALRGDTVGIAGIGKPARLVIGQAIRLKNAVVA